MAETFDSTEINFMFIEHDIHIAIPANKVEHTTDGWVIAYQDEALVAKIKDEFLKGFYLYKVVYKKR